MDDLTKSVSFNQRLEFKNATPSKNNKNRAQVKHIFFVLQDCKLRSVKSARPLRVVWDFLQTHITP